LERFENCKREFVEKGVSDKELLLFHGTDASNLDNIFTSNFKIDFQPINRPKVELTIYQIIHYMYHVLVL